MKRKKKLSLVISSYDDLKNPIYSGGGAHSVHQVAKNLTKKHKVTVLTGTYKNAKNEILDKVEYVRIGSDVLGHKIGQLIYQYSLIKYARKKNYDIWIESSTPPFTFSLLPLFCKKPVISWINMLCSYDMQRKYKLNFRTIEQELCKLYKYVIAPTDWVKNEIKTMNKKTKIFTITQGFEREMPKKPLKKIAGLDKYLLFIGRIEVNQKGLDLLLQALPFTDKKTKVVIAGSGSYQEEHKLSNLIERFRIAKKTKRIGRVRGEKKEILLKYAKAVIIPSRFETFSLSALEAIMHQKPIICFDIPQLKWIPKKYAFKINPFSIPELAYCIDKVFLSKIKSNISDQERKEYLKKFNWTNIAQKFEVIISKALYEKR